MKNKLLLTAIACLWFAGTVAASPRQVITLGEGWGIKPITSVTKETPLAKITVPHTWNANYPKGSTLYNREMMVYKRDLEMTPEMAGKRLFLYFEGINSAADVFVNGTTVGAHLGGYTACSFEITDEVKPGTNKLEVWVSNALRTDVLPISGDFNVYGGIHRPCHLIVTEQDCISPVFYASPGVFIHQDNITEKAADITVETILSLKGTKNGLTLKATVNDASGQTVASAEAAVTGENVKQRFTLPSPVLWNGKKNPHLYTVTVELYDNGALKDQVTQRTGLRYFSADPDKGFFLNGNPYDIHGFNRHEDVKGKGSALTMDDYTGDMKLILESGATAMRLAHYPHAEPMYNLSDENGIILWTELPFCGPGGYEYTGYVKSVENNARQVLKELVYQKFNHPSIMFWGIFNEILATDGVRFEAYDNPVPFVKELNAMFKQLDPSRLTTFGTCVSHTYYLGASDLIAWNKYFRGKTPKDEYSPFFDDVRRTSGGQAVGVSEYGAAASAKFHDPQYASYRAGGRWFSSEEGQNRIHEGAWEAFTERPYLWGKFIWVFADYQSYLRQEGDTDGINDKGVLTYDRTTKKDAFYFYKANWNPEPMIYITSRRFVERTEALTEVKVYSNLPEATLYINGRKIGKQKKDAFGRIIWREITLSKGDNEIRVEGKSGKQTLTDSCVWTHGWAQEKNRIPEIHEVGAAMMPEDITPITGAPFDMPQFKKPVFPDFAINIADRGAKAGVLATSIINQAIVDVNKKGGGTVVVPAGKWKSGRITLMSNVNLHIAEGAEIEFSGDIKDYLPAVLTRHEGVEIFGAGALIYANNQRNIAVTGKGTITGPPLDSEVRKRTNTAAIVENDVPVTMPLYERLFDGMEGRDFQPPRTIAPIHCTHVFIEGVTLNRSALWNVVPTYCENVIIRGITVNSPDIPRSDGIDIESSKDVLIEYCTLNTHDDCFTLKSGRAEDGMRVNRPTENVVIRRSLATGGPGGITYGSETAGNIKNVYAYDCVIKGTWSGLRFKTRRSRGGGIENILCERIRMMDVKEAFTWDMLGSRKWVGELADRMPLREINDLTPVVRHIHVRDFRVESSEKMIVANCIPETPLSDVLIEYGTVRCRQLIPVLNDTDGFTLNNITVHSEDNKIHILDGRNVLFKDMKFMVPGGEVLVNIQGNQSKDILFKGINPDIKVIERR